MFITKWNMEMKQNISIKFLYMLQIFLLLTFSVFTYLFNLGTIHIWYPWKLSNFQDPPPPPPTPCPSASKISPHPWPCSSNFKRTSPPPPPTSYGTTTALCMWTKEIKRKTKLTHAKVKWITRSIVRLSPQTIQWRH